MSSVRELEFDDEFLDAATDFVVDEAYNIEIFLLDWIVELSFEIALAREDEANVVVVHDDDDIIDLNNFDDENLGFLIIEIDDFFHMTSTMIELMKWVKVDSMKLISMMLSARCVS